MAETIAKLVIKRTGDALEVPPVDLLQYGELAVNFTDGKLYYKNASNQIQVIGIRNAASRTENQIFTGQNSFTSTNTFTGSNTFSGTNLFSNSNTFSAANTFSASNTFSAGNTFSGSNTFSSTNTFSGSNTFSAANTFSGNNTFSGSNTFSNNNTFSGSNTFSAANTFTGVNTFKAVAMTPLTLTDGTILWDGTLGNLASVTLTQDSNLNGIGSVAPGTYVLRVIQDGTGGHTLTFGENFKSVNGDVIEVAAGAGAISILTILNSGGSDLYVMGQANFVSFGSAPPFEGDVPFTITVTGITPTTPTNLNGTYERTGDENDLPAWQQIIDPLNRVVIHADGDGYYLLEIQDRALDTDPWVTVGTPHFEITSIGGDVLVGPWVDTSGTYGGTMDVAPDIVTPAYVLTNLGTAEVIYLYPKDDAVWYATPVAPGNAYAAINGGSKLLLVDAGGIGYWELGIEASNGIGEFIAFQYHVDLVNTVTPVGPLGGYGSIIAPGTPPDYNNPTIGSANYTVTAFTP